MASTSSAVRAAEPLLASSLVQDGELEALFERVVGSGVKEKGVGARERLQTGARSVDEALAGGLEEGRVVGVSCEVGGGMSDFCLTLLANSLLQDRPGTAAIVDTTGNVDIMRLYTFIVSRLQSDTQVLERTRSGFISAELSAEEVGAKVLEHVKIMRVFDLVGVVEAVGEIREELEEKDQDQAAADKNGEVLESEAPRFKKTVIADSEDEDEDEDEMLLNTAPTSASHSVVAAVPPNAPTLVPKPDLQGISNNRRTASEGRMSLILIDNLAYVINPLLKKDYVQTQALSTSFLLTLTNLTHTHNLRTLLLNPSTFLQPSTPRPAPTNPTRGPAPPPQQQHYQPPIPPSIFASNESVPALGSVWSPFLDLHLLVGKMPRRKADARVFYGEGGRVGVGKGVDMVSVVEIIADRYGGRGGAWGTSVQGDKGITDT